MNVEDLVLVSVDDHLIEPRDAFTPHMPAAFKDRAPRMERRGQKDVWLIEGRAFGTVGLNAVAGRPREEYGMEPTSHDHMRRGCYDIHARVDDMNANGVLGSICFPTLPGFAGARFATLPDKEYALALIRAYNDWHIHEWCGAHPGRFIPLPILPLWSPEACAQEVRRLALLGAHAVTFPDNPTKMGLPSIHSPDWDPLWRACADNKVVICCHIGTGATAEHASSESPIEAWIITMPMSIANSAADWLYAPMWKKFPSLRMALSEGGIGWIPYFLERADFAHSHHGAWTNFDFGKDKPSDVFKRHIITCFIDDNFGAKNLADVGEDMVTWECDFPHSDSTWPDSPEYLWRSLRDLSRSQIDKITHLNAMREFSYDPFSLLGRENCTVGALREKAIHITTTPTQGLGGAKPLAGTARPITSGDINRMFAAAE